MFVVLSSVTLFCFLFHSPFSRQYWQVSSVVLKALGTAGTIANKDSSRIVSQYTKPVINWFPHYNGILLNLIKLFLQ